MFSATAITAAIAVLAASTTLLVPDRVPDGVVAVTGSASSYHDTISGAVMAAQDGDTVRVGPGTYVEHVVIDKDITLLGEGPAEGVVLRAPEDGATASIPDPDREGAFLELPFAIELRGSDATVTGLTFQGRGSAIVANGGAPTISANLLSDVGWPWHGTGDELNAIYIVDVDGASILDNVLTGGGSIEGLSSRAVRIERNILIDGPDIAGGFDQGSVIRSNEISDPSQNAITLFDGGASIEGNVITGVPITAILLGWRDDAGVVSEVTGNEIDGATEGVHVFAGSRADIVGNQIEGARVGVSVSNSFSTISGNVLEGNQLGLSIDAGAPSLDGNTIVDSITAISLDGATLPTMSENTICGSRSSILTLGETVMPDLAGNDVCQVLAKN